MSFASRITRAPDPFDAARGSEAADMLGLVDGALRRLVRGAAGSSPFLAAVIDREAEWCSGVLQDAPEPAFESILSEVVSAECGDLGTDLRRAKRRMSLLVALADLGGVWSLEDVTASLTRFADLAVDRALREAIGVEIARGRLPGQSEEDVASGGGLSVIAMGKMGAFELNYSSDIDLVCLYDETRFDPVDYAAARSSFVRAVRRMSKTLSERTAEGYVFRTDLRLRPDASVTPVAISMEAAERYYEAFGRTWERAAYIKARPCAGDQAAGAQFLDALRPFVWRRHLDFAAIQDAHDMRTRIRDHKGLHGAATHLGHDLKLGRGGIREIEFFTQTRQIIAGGRDPDLRVASTLGGLARLAAKGWIGEDVARTLADDYRTLREAEHRVQMIADQQTHELPASAEDFARFAALSGRSPADSAQELEELFERVAQLTEEFFVPTRAGKAGTDRQLSETAREIVDRWAGYPALRSPRAVQIFKRVRPALFERLARATDPDEALAHFDGFLAGLPAGVQVFSLFEANPQLLDLVVDVVDTAPGLARYLAQNAGVFDAVIGGDFFSDWPGGQALRQSLSSALEEVSDYEARLDRARVWAREWHFRIGVHHLRGLIDAEEAGRQYADLATASVAALWHAVVGHFSEKHGEPPGRGATVLGMGSLGARRLSSDSDLDLIVIYDAGGIEASDGRRPLASRAYYARLTQALVTAISAPTAEGRLYEVDMRLRPSGRQGPVATGLEAFRSYQADKAWTWEHLALTRARPVAGEGLLGDEIEEIRREIISAPRDCAGTIADVAEMRDRLAEAKPGSGALDAKAGRGRLQEIELLAQAGALLDCETARETDRQIMAAGRAFALSGGDIEALSAAMGLFWRVQAVTRLVAGHAARPDFEGAGAQAFLLRETEAGSLADLEERMATVAEHSAAIIDRVLGPPGGKS